MNLQDFIKQTLIQIARGIEGAAAELKNSKAIVNPRNVQTGAGDDPNVYGFVDTQTKFCKTVQKVEFDVAVTASTGTATKGGIDVMVGAIGLGSQGKSESQDSSIFTDKVPCTDGSSNGGRSS